MKFKVPEHDRDCAFRQAKGVTSVRCTCKAKFGGKPFAYWQDMAEELVADCLLRDVDRTEDEYSLPRYLASVRLWDIARREVPKELLAVLQQRDACLRGMQAALNDICSGKWNPLFDPSAFGMPGAHEEDDGS